MENSAFCGYHRPSARFLRGDPRNGRGPPAVAGARRLAHPTDRVGVQEDLKKSFGRADPAKDKCIVAKNMTTISKIRATKTLKITLHNSFAGIDSDSDS